MEEKKVRMTEAEKANAVQADAEALQEETLDKVAGGDDPFIRPPWK